MAAPGEARRWRGVWHWRGHYNPSVMAVARLFVAVRVEPAAPLRALLAELEGVGRPVKVIPPRNLHFTLSFLGAVDRGRIDEIAAAMQMAVEDVASFEMVLRGVGTFGAPARPRVLWLAPADPEPLCRVQAAVSEALDAIGFAPEDRPWGAHLTVARINRPRRRSRGRQRFPDPAAAAAAALAPLLERHRDADFGRYPVEAITLMQSDLQPAGPIYTPVATAPLGG